MPHSTQTLTVTIPAYDLQAVPDEETREQITNPFMQYAVSKMLAHAAGNKFVEDHKVQFDLIRVLPGYVQGANELYESADEMRDFDSGSSNEGTLRTALGAVVGSPRVTHQVFLDDVANAHVLALKPEVAKHLDNLLVVGNDGVSIPWQDFVPIIKNQFPEAIASSVLKPKVEDENMTAEYDVRSSEEALGFKFAGVDEMVKSVVGQYVKLAGAA